MKYYLAIAAILISAVLLVSCTSSILARPLPSLSISEATSEAVSGTASQLISPADAKQRLDAEQGIILLDVRTAEEYAEGHLKGSVLLPVDNIGAEAAAKLADKDAVIFVYCRSGRRSAIAAEQLVKMGYTQVFDLGGIIEWPYEVVKE